MLLSSETRPEFGKSNLELWYHNSISQKSKIDSDFPWTKKRWGFLTMKKIKFSIV